MYKTLTIDEIKQQRKKRLVITVLNVFGDESHDEKEQRVYTVSGIAGTQEERDALTTTWNKRIRGIPFHSADCEAGRGPYEKIPKSDRLELYADLVNMFAQTNLMGFAATVDLQGFKYYFPKILPTEAYHLCFRKVITYFAQMGYMLIPQERVNFIFDINSKIQYSTVKLFEWIKDLSENEWKYSVVVSEITFASRKDPHGVGIQVADILARESMKHYDNFFVGPRVYKKTRKSFQALKAPKYEFAFYTKEYFEDFKREVFDGCKENPALFNAYEEWLLKNKRKNNATSQFEFLIYFDSANRTESNKLNEVVSSLES